MIIYGGYHHINKIGEFLQFSSQRKGIRAWNFRMMIRKIWQFLWYQNRNNFEKNEKRKDQAPLKVLATIPYFNFHFFPHLLIFLQFGDPSYVLKLIHQSNPAEMT